MAKLVSFTFITLDGYYKGVGDEISWHKHGQEESEFSSKSMGSGDDSILMFGRLTYEMMAGFWPTEMGRQMNPTVAEGMTNAEKIVFSKTLTAGSWKNTRVLNGNLAAEVATLKKGSKDIAVLGSGSVLSQLAEANLVDRYQVMLDPVAIGAGVSIFSGMNRQLNLKLVETKTFKSGVILLNYEPA
jgi:dihydrofolate reductase